MGKLRGDRGGQSCEALVRSRVTCVGRIRQKSERYWFPEPQCIQALYPQVWMSQYPVPIRGPPDVERFTRLFKASISLALEAQRYFNMCVSRLRKQRDSISDGQSRRKAGKSVEVRWRRWRRRPLLSASGNCSPVCSEGRWFKMFRSSNIGDA